MRARPYAKIRGSEPSVTTVIGAMTSKPGMPWAAARETAAFAVHHPEAWQDLETEDAIDRLRKHHKGVWDSRAITGTLCHSVNERWIDGETLDLAELVAEATANEYYARNWFGHEDEAVARLAGYVDGLERFWHDWQPTTIAAEYVVRTPGAYIGTADWKADIAGERWLLDIKTTAQQDADKGVYHDSWALQLASYRYADEVVAYEWDDNNKPHEVGCSPSTHDVGRCGVIHLRGDGEYTLWEVNAGEAARDAFLSMLSAYRWIQGLGQPVAVKPLAVAS